MSEVSQTGVATIAKGGELDMEIGSLCKGQVNGQLRLLCLDGNMNSAAFNQRGKTTTFVAFPIPGLVAFNSVLRTARPKKLNTKPRMHSTHCRTPLSVSSQRFSV